MAGTEKIGIDASVAIQWFIDETNSLRARKLAEDHARRIIDLASPDLLPYEVLNALRYAPEMGIETLKTASKVLDKMNLDLHPFTDELSEQTIENAYKYGITIYDASYLTLGEIKNIPIYTADVKLIKKVNTKTLKPIQDY